MKILHIGEDIVTDSTLPGVNTIYRHAKYCGDAHNTPTWYKVVGGEVVLRDDWEDIRDAELAARAVIVQRKTDIVTAQESSGLKSVTVAQAENYIDSQLDAATTVAQTKEAIRRILKRMVPYLLQ